MGVTRCLLKLPLRLHHGYVLGICEHQDWHFAATFLLLDFDHGLTIHVGKWTEANMISQRQQAALDEYIASQKAKLGELARAKYEPKPRETKKEEPKVVKPKAEPPAKPQPKVEPVAEPPPPKPEKDTEFWNYYDKKTNE